MGRRSPASTGSLHRSLRAIRGSFRKHELLQCVVEPEDSFVDTVPVPKPDRPLTFKDVLQEVDELLEMLRRLDTTTISGETMTVLAIQDQLSQVRGRLADLVVQRMFRT